MKTLKTTLFTILMVIGFTSLSQAQSKTEGIFSKFNYTVKGSWSIVEEGGNTYLELSDDFSTQRGPDLKIFVTKTSLKSLNGKNAINDAELVSVLKKNKGGQRYLIPSGVNLDNYTTLLIHCERFSKPWAGASLE